MVIDAATQKDKLDIERERIAAQERIAGLQVGAKVATDKATLSAKQQADGLRIGVDVAREAAQQAHASGMHDKTHASNMEKQTQAQMAQAQTAAAKPAPKETK